MSQYKQQQLLVQQHTTCPDGKAMYSTPQQSRREGRFDRAVAASLFLHQIKKSVTS